MRIQLITTANKEIVSFDYQQIIGWYAFFMWIVFQIILLT